MDWCGYYVVPAAIDMRFFLEASLNDKPGVVEVFSYPPFDTCAVYDLRDFRIDNASDLRYVGAVLKAMLKEGRLKGFESLKLRFMKSEEFSNLTGNRDVKDLPVRKGLSSSAALSVATAAAVDLLVNCPKGCCFLRKLG